MMDDYWTHLRGGHNFMRRNQELIEPQGHATDLFTRWACDYLAERASAGKPFLLYLAYNARMIRSNLRPSGWQRCNGDNPESTPSGRNSWP